jgi:hypothetical protein
LYAAVLTGICLYAACSCHEITEWKRPGQFVHGIENHVFRVELPPEHAVPTAAGVTEPQITLQLPSPWRCRTEEGCAVTTD